MKKQNILMVDDHPENLIALRAVLESPDYNITEATSGPEALKFLLDTNYDLILLDVQMPVLNGFETADLIRSRPQSETIPLIFITARSMDEASENKAYNSGAADYLVKPFNPETLKKKVAFFLNHSNKLRMNQQLIDSEVEYNNFIKVFHELINPLWAILLNVQMLKKFYSKDTKLVLNKFNTKLESMEVSTRKLKSLIDNYLSQLRKL